MEVVVAVTLGGFGKSAYLVGLAAALFLAWRALAGGTNDSAEAWAAVGQGALLVDVRSEAEFQSGHLDGAINVPHDQVGSRLTIFGMDKNRPIVVYCRSGRRSGLAKLELEKSGYGRVINGGGLDQMRASQPKGAGNP